MALEVTLPAYLAQLGIHHLNSNELAETRDTPNNAYKHYAALDAAAVQRVKDIAPDAPEFKIGRREYDPAAAGEGNTTKSASHSRVTLKDGTSGSLISINPKADSAYYAHELGHGISQQTKIGKAVNDARHMVRKNPKLSKALAMTLPAALAGTGAALQEGDDDLVGSIALAAAAASPKLVDEALATKNAFAIMDNAGIRATLGQRGRLAGGYLSYVAPVLVAGSVANAAGNYMDDYTAVYNFGADQTDGTLMP